MKLRVVGCTFRKTLLWVASRVRLATQRPVESAKRDSKNPIRQTRLQARLTRLQARLTRLQAGQAPDLPVALAKCDYL
jgi:hypothetical protein